MRTIRVTGEKGVYKQRFVGYNYSHMMKGEFESDNDRLGKVLYALAYCDVRPEFRISYTVKDPEAAKSFDTVTVIWEIA